MAHFVDNDKATIRHC